MLPTASRNCYAVGTAALGPGAANFPAPVPHYFQTYATDEFLKSRVFKPLFFVVYAFLVANAVRDSIRPERFLIAFGISAVLPALSIMVAAVGGSVDQRGTYLGGIGVRIRTPTGCCLHLHRARCYS